MIIPLSALFCCLGCRAQQVARWGRFQSGAYAPQPASNLSRTSILHSRRTHNLQDPHPIVPVAERFQTEEDSALPANALQAIRFAAGSLPQKGDSAPTRAVRSPLAKGFKRVKQQHGKSPKAAEEVKFPLPREFPYYITYDGDLFVKGNNPELLSNAEGREDMGTGQSYIRHLKSMKCDQACCRDIPACNSNSLLDFDDCRDTMQELCHIKVEWDWMFVGSNWWEHPKEKDLTNKNVACFAGMSPWQEEFATTIKPVRVLGLGSLENNRSCPKYWSSFVYSNRRLYAGHEHQRKFFAIQMPYELSKIDFDYEIAAYAWQSTARKWCLYGVTQFNNDTQASHQDKCQAPTDLQFTATVAARVYGNRSWGNGSLPPKDKPPQPGNAVANIFISLNIAILAFLV